MFHPRRRDAIAKRLRLFLVILGLVAMGIAPSAALAAEGSQADASQTAAGDSHQRGPGFDEHHENSEESDINVCSKATPTGTARCYARVRTDNKAKSATPAKPGSAQPAGTLGNSGAYDPAYLESAYNVMSSIQAGAGSGQTVAIVDAYDDPRAESDMSYYRSYFGLPPCTTANGCFSKINQSGGSTPPAANQGWAEEISLDLDMTSAICPNCKILLVEANTASFNDLGTAVNTAVAKGANAVSNSYGGSEWSGETSTDAFYDHAGVAITVSSGDNGYGVEYPAASPFVTAVGGTSLTQNTNTGSRNGSETAWSGAGSGCSAYETKASWQKDAGCTHRAVSDVSAVADPNTGVWVYDTYIDPGFEIFGGTSAASPIVSSAYALAANPASSNQLTSYPYGHTASLNDVTSGSNGTCGSYLCTAGSGYDGPTGLGTPNGSAAFTPVPVTPVYSIVPSTASLNVAVGATGTDSIAVNTSSGYSSAVNLTVTSSPTLPSGTTAVLNPTWVIPGSSSTLTVSVPAGTAAGSYSLTISGDGMTPATTATVTLNITVPTYTVTAASTSLTVPVGSNGTDTISVKSSNGYTSAVNLAVTSSPALPSGATAVLTPTSVTPGGSSTLTVSVPAGTTAGSYTLTISGDGVTPAPTATVTLKITVPTYSISPASSSLSVAAGANGTDKVSVSSSTGYTSAVNLTVASSPALPSGVTAALSPTSVAPGGSSTLSVTAPSGAVPGSYTLTITGDGLTPAPTATVNLAITNPSFSISSNPTSITVKHGSTARYALTLASNNGYSGTVTLSFSGEPTNTSTSFTTNPVSVTPTSNGTTTLRIGTHNSTPRGTYTVTVKNANDPTNTAESIALTLIVQ